MRRVLLALVVVVLAPPALAGDGVLEINQTCAVQTGCFAGDTPGFPVTIGQEGSYRLTSNLVVPEGAKGIDQTGSSSHVTLDLNGFSLIGPGTTTGPQDGISMSGGQSWEIRNGTVRDFGNRGIADSFSTARAHRIIGVRIIGNASLGISLGGQGHRIEDCEIRSNTTVGIAPGSNSLLLRNVIVENGGFGISFNGSGTGYGDNVISDNGSAAITGAATQVSGNVCDGAPCP